MILLVPYEFRTETVIYTLKNDLLGRVIKFLQRYGMAEQKKRRFRKKRKFSVKTFVFTHACTKRKQHIKKIS